MNPNVKFHKRIPLGMVEGNQYRVWTLNGSELRIRQSKKYGPYINYRHHNAQKFITINRLYKEIFPEKKKSTKVQTEFSKRDLMYQNRKGTYVAPVKYTPPIISVSGYVLRGLDKGKHLRDMDAQKLLWYVDNIKLSHNELVEIDRELKKRGV